MELKNRITGLVAFVLLCVSSITQADAQVSVQEMDSLSKRQQAIVPIAAFTAKGDMTGLRTALAEGLEAGLTISEVKEVLTHLYAYTGFPRSLNALTAFMGVLETRKAAGIQDSEGVEAAPLPQDKTSLELGTAVQTRVSGRPVQGGVMAFAPAIDYYLKAHLFGDIFGRDNLGETDREIATLSALASLEGTESQFKSHVRIATNVGLSGNQIWQIAQILKDRVGLREAWRANQVLSSLFERKYPMPEPIDDVFPRGRLSTFNYFTGDVYNSRLVSTDSTTPCQASNVTFSAGARTRWHTHTGTQILLCTAGRGWYQEKGKPAQPLEAGVSIVIRPGVVHWHGAAYDSEFSHISVIPNPAQNKDTWLEAVSEEEYMGLMIK
ncbi:MAG: carboxymuconolactone decarboxylase family protein [Bacteroides sp.]|nr:carboxymuconolactone decarboxylase family protein [Bacteroides sp.]